MREPVGSIPVLHAEAWTLSLAWERSMIELHERGCRARTEYDQAGHPPSIDATMMVTALAPDSEPMIHRCFPGGLEDLEEYRQEVVDGIKDHWVRDPDDPEDTRWEYTYHERLRAYKVETVTPWGRNFDRIDQLDAIVSKLTEAPHSRRANAVTWQPWRDVGISDPPCLQSVWCRILPDDEGVWRLNMNVRFRSRDAYGAAYMNMFAFVCLQEDLARQVAERAGREVKLGRYCDLSDSYHIYGKDRERFERELLGAVKQRSFEDRTWTREFARPHFEAARLGIAAKVAAVDAGRNG